jgi:hypothetical protein
MIIGFCGGASFEVFDYQCDEHAIFYGYIEQGINFQHEQTSSKDNRLLLS